MDTARTLEEKRERVLEQMRAIRSMRPGSVTEQYLKVTHKGKRKPVMGAVLGLHPEGSGKDGRTTTE